MGHHDLDPETGTCGPSSPEELESLRSLINTWAQAQRSNPIVDAVELVPDSDPRWFVRVIGEEKSVFSVWFALRQRTLHVETYFMPAPLENAAGLYEYLLRKSMSLFGLHFAIGLEDAVYLVGQINNAEVTEAECDRLLGTAYVTTEPNSRLPSTHGWMASQRSTRRR